MPEPTDSFVIHSFYARFLLDYMRARGGDVATLEKRFSLPKATDEAPTLMLPLGLVRALSDAAETMLGDPLIGAHVACSLERGSFGIFELAVRSAPTLRAALESVARYATAAISRTEHFSFEAEGEGGVFIHRLPAEAMEGARHQSEFAMVSATLFCRALTRAPSWAPLRVTLSHHAPAPAPRAELERIFGTREIVFEHPFNSISFDRDILDTPLDSADRAASRILDQQARIVLDLLDADGARGDEGFVNQVRRVVRRGLGDGSASIEAAADKLRMSPRTLQRRLSAAGTSYAAVLDDLRLSLAKQSLDDPRVSLTEIAARLDYSDLRAFVRAFKGWTGMTPGRYRRDRR